MPYNLEQHKLFEAAARNPAIAEKRGIPQSTAARLAHEGVKADNAGKQGLNAKFMAIKHSMLGK